MSLEKKVLVDKIEILENGILQVRTATRIFEDDVILSESFNRRMLTPLDDLTGEDKKIQNLANAIWTDEIKENYERLMEAQNGHLDGPETNTN